MGTDPIKMFCSQCGNRIASKDEKCPACGLSLTTRQTKADFLSGPFVQRLPLVTLSPGDTLMKRFQIRKHLGNGRFSSVYLASDAVQNKEVALKTVEVGPLSEDLADLRLKREMKVHNKITDHKYVIRVYDMHFSPGGGTGLLLLSMELANGGTFRKYLLEHAEDLETRRTQGLDYFKQACRGVGAVHDAMAVHRDLKPENLLFSNEILKVSDFGSASYAQTLTLSSTSTWETPSLDEGTPTYMSPEHINAPHPEDVDSRTDIYSLGIILFELLHPKCRPPFGGSENRIKECHLTVTAPYLKETDKGMADIIAKCLEKDPANRYQTVWELIDDLEKGQCSTRYSAGANVKIAPEAKRKEEARKSIQETWEKASRKFSNGDLNGAMELTEEVLRMEPDHTNAKQLKEKLKTKFNQAEALYEEIATNLKRGDLTELIGLLQEANSIYPEHPSGRSVYVKISSRAERLVLVINQGSKAIGQRHWGSALSLYREANQVNGTSAQIKQIVQFIIDYMNVKQRDTTRGRELCNYYFHQILFLEKCINQLKENLEEKLDELNKASRK